MDCRACGAEDELYTGGHCWGCTLAATVDRLLTDPSTGTVAPGLVPLAEALKSMKRANSGLTWIRQQHVTGFLQTLAVTPSLTHQAIDALPRSHTREYVPACSSSTRPFPNETFTRPAMRHGHATPWTASPTRSTVTSSAATSAGSINAG